MQCLWSFKTAYWKELFILTTFTLMKTELLATAKCVNLGNVGKVLHFCNIRTFQTRLVSSFICPLPLCSIPGKLTRVCILLKDPFLCTHIFQTKTDIMQQGCIVCSNGHYLDLFSFLSNSKTKKKVSEHKIKCPVISEQIPGVTSHHSIRCYYYFKPA